MERKGIPIEWYVKRGKLFALFNKANYFYALKTVENELDSLLERGSTSWEECSLEKLVQTGKNIDEPCWNLNQSFTEMSLRDIEKIMGIRHLWDNLCNCGCILEDIGKPDHTGWENCGGCDSCAGERPDERVCNLY